MIRFPFRFRCLSRFHGGQGTGKTRRVAIFLACIDVGALRLLASQSSTFTSLPTTQNPLYTACSFTHRQLQLVPYCGTLRFRLFLRVFVYTPCQALICTPRPDVLVPSEWRLFPFSTVLCFVLPSQTFVPPSRRAFQVMVTFDNPICAPGEHNLRRNARQTIALGYLQLILRPSKVFACTWTLQWHYSEYTFDFLFVHHWIFGVDYCACIVT